MFNKITNKNIIWNATRAVLKYHINVSKAKITNDKSKKRKMSYIPLLQISKGINLRETSYNHNRFYKK